MDYAHNLLVTLPELILAIGAIALMMVAAYAGDRHTRAISVAAVVLLVGAAMVSLQPMGGAFDGLYVSDAFSSFAKLLIYLGAAVAVILAVETKSLLLGEAASVEAQGRIRAAIEASDGIDGVIHMKTMHLGPEELLVAVKVAVTASGSAADVARAIDTAEVAIREVEPTAQVIYLEPDIQRVGTTSA